MKTQVKRQLEYWQRLLGRLDSRRFPRNGELFQKALAAQRAAHAVWEYIEFHRPQSAPEDREFPF